MVHRDQGFLALWKEQKTLGKRIEFCMNELGFLMKVIIPMP
jgi:hypothetical protein